MHIDNMKEFKENYSGNGVTSFALNINGLQYEKVLQNLNKMKNNPGYYSLFGYHCSSVAYGVLIESGIEINNPKPMIFGRPTLGDTGLNMAPWRFQMILEHSSNSSLVQSKSHFYVR